MSQRGSEPGAGPQSDPVPPPWMVGGGRCAESVLTGHPIELDAHKTHREESDQTLHPEPCVRQAQEPIQRYGAHGDAYQQSGDQHGQVPPVVLTEIVSQGEDIPGYEHQQHHGEHVGRTEDRRHQGHGQDPRPRAETGLRQSHQKSRRGDASPMPNRQITDLHTAQVFPATKRVDPRPHEVKAAPGGRQKKDGTSQHTESLPPCPQDSPDRAGNGRCPASSDAERLGKACRLTPRDRPRSPVGFACIHARLGIR